MRGGNGRRRQSASDRETPSKPSEIIRIPRRERRGLLPDLPEVRLRTAADVTTLVATQSVNFRSTLDAADTAFSNHAYAEASELCRMAIGALPNRTGAALFKIEALLRLGDCERESHNYDAMHEAFLEAADLARLLGRTDLLVRAALGIGKTWSGSGQGVSDCALISLMEEALGTLTDREDAQRAVLLARLAVDIYWSERHDESIAIGKRAVEMARRLGDPAVLVDVLSYFVWMLWNPDNLEQRLAAASEMLRMAEEVRDWTAALRAREARLSAMLEIGEIHDLDRELLAIENLVRVSGKKLGHIERFRTMRALMRGEFADAEQWLGLELKVARERGDTTLLQTYTGQLGQLIGERGDNQNFTSMITGSSSEMPQLPVVRMAVALSYARGGRLTEARTELEYLAAENCAKVPGDWNWLGTVAHLGEVCVRVGHFELADIFHRLLAPYAGRSVTLG